MPHTCLCCGCVVDVSWLCLWVWAGGLCQATDGGDEFMAVKPWLGAIVEPTLPPTINPKVPDEELHLRWVHGYRALDSRNNLRYTAKGELVYPAAALGVVYSTKKWQQRCGRVCA